MDEDASRAEGQRDAARAGAELQGARLRRTALGREHGEEVRRGPGHRGPHIPASYLPATLAPK